MNDKVETSAHNVALVDMYWLLVNAAEDETKLPMDKILLLLQYMLTSYLSTVPEQRDTQVDVLKLLRDLLPKTDLD